MGRVIDNQTNLWGAYKGIEPQRSDLWVVDFNTALTKLNDNAWDGEWDANGKTGVLVRPYVPRMLGTYYAQSVVLPDLKTRPDVIRRDSRPYQTPSWDEPLDGITMTFMLDCYDSRSKAKNDPYQSDIYQMLDIWRASVRAGRGSMSGEYSLILNKEYRIDYAFDVNLKLMRGELPSVTKSGNAAATAPSFDVLNDLQFSMKYVLVNCWLGSFKVGEVNYETAKPVLLTAIFYAEDIKQETQDVA